MLNGCSGEEGKEPSVRINFLYNLAYQVLVVVLPLISTPYLTRTLGATPLGVYSYTYSVAALFALFGLLGVSNHGSRAVALAADDDRERSRTFWTVYIGQLGCAVLVLLAYSIALGLGVFEYECIQTIWLLYLISVALDVNWYFFGVEKFKLTVTRNLIIKLATFVGMFVVVRGEGDLVPYCLLMSVGMLVSQVALWSFLLRDVRWVRPMRRDVFAHLKKSLILFVPVVAVSVYTVLDKVLLGSMAGADQTAFFDNALKVASVPGLVVTALGTVMLPHISRLVGRGKLDEARRSLGDSFSAVSLATAYMGFGVASASLEFVPLYYGPGFAECGPVMTILVLDVPFFAWANVTRTQYLIPNRRDKVYVTAVVCGAAANVVVNLAAIPFLGALGAAMGTFCAEAMVCLVQLWGVRKELPLGQYLASSWGCFVVGAIACVMARLASGPLGVLGGMAAFLGVVLVFTFVFVTISLIWYMSGLSGFPRETLKKISNRKA